MAHSTFDTNGFHLTIQRADMAHLVVLASWPLMLHQGIPVHCECCPECKQRWEDACRIAKDGMSASELSAHGIRIEAEVSS